MWGVEICKIYSKIMKKYHHCVKFTYPLSFNQISYIEPDSMKRSQITLLRGQLPPPPWWDRWRSTPPMMRQVDNPHDETDGGQLPPWWDRWRTTLPPWCDRWGTTPPWWDRWRTMRHLITKVYEKPGTDMGDFWISFLEMPDPLVGFLDACHARNSNESLSLTYSLLLD